MGVPEDEQGWRRLIRSGQPPAWQVLAEATGGSAWRRDGVLAAIVPIAPERSIFNSVFYGDPAPLLESLDEIAAAYDAAGCAAWAVWVPEADRETAVALETAGHKLDSEPRDMGMALADLAAPEPDPELEIFEREDYVALARINEASYGYASGELEAIERARMPGTRIYFGSLGGEEIATLGIVPLNSDAIVVWVAVLPEARGRGVSGRMLAPALENASRDGLETTTLQASSLGYPVYEKLGYRDYGVVEMWERRASD